MIQAKTSQVSARAAEDSATAAQRSTQLSSEATRGYLSIESLTLSPLQADKHPVYYLVWNNDGNSPTEITSTKMGAGIAPTITQTCNVGGTGTSAPSLFVSPKSKRTQRFTAAASLTSAEIED